MTAAPDVIEREVHVQTIVPLLNSWLQTQAFSTHEAAKARELLANSLSAECISCGIQIRGADLIFILEPAKQNENAKIDRLRFGYCARKGCDSYYLKFLLQSSSKLNWNQVLAEFEPSSVRPSGDQPRAPLPVHSWNGPLVLKLAVTLGILF